MNLSSLLKECNIIEYNNLETDNLSDIDMLKEYILDYIILIYKLLSLRYTSQFENMERTIKYFSEQLKVKYVSKNDIIMDNHTRLYICIDSRMREYADYFIV